MIARLRAAGPALLCSRWAAASLCLAFLAHTTFYSYFFVDDEGIPFVYARNLLRGRGLAYSTLEGRVEGYSDFLMIFVDGVTLSIVRLVHAPLFTVFTIGKLLSLSCGVVTVWLVVRHLQSRSDWRATIAGGLCIVLAGPLALWSCSSLETVPLTLAFTVLVLSLRRAEWLAAFGAAVVLLLLRIDGPVYIAAALIGGLVASTSSQRRPIVHRVLLPVLAVTVVYHAWRFLYFDRWLTTPLEAKVMYKLTGSSRLAIKAAPENYLSRFAGLYGAMFLLTVSFGWLFLRRTRTAAEMAITAGLLGLYVAAVGDWMFGFRFCVPLIPLLAILFAETTEAISERVALAGTLATVAGVAWLAHVAVVFERRYEAVEHRPALWHSPTLRPQRLFAPWWSAYTVLRDRVGPASLIAYNQAGFVPFMLDANNIDNLGICSRFYAELPAQDVFYTEVGRYSPLTNKDVYSAGLAYLLYRKPSYIIERTDLVSHANRSIPDEILGGRYRHLWSDADNVVFVPTDKDASEFQRDPTLFLENVVHVARLARAMESQGEIPVSEYGTRLPFLKEQLSEITVWGKYELQMFFETGEVPVYELHIEGVKSEKSATLILVLWSSAGARVHEERLVLEPERPSGLHVRLAVPVRAASASLRIASTEPGLFTVVLDDLRVQAQPPALARYIADRLTFSKPAARDVLPREIASPAAAMQSATNVAMNRSPSAVK